MTPHFYRNLDDGESSIQRCLRLIETHAPRFMKIGGGYLRQERERKTIGAEAKRRIVELRLQGMSVSEIARTVGFAKCTCGRVLARHCNMRIRVYAERDKRRKQAAELYRKGLTTRAIASVMNCSQSAVSKWLVADRTVFGESPNHKNA